MLAGTPAMLITILWFYSVPLGRCWEANQLSQFFFFFGILLRPSREMPGLYLDYPAAAFFQHDSSLILPFNFIV
jgi:hypothetical protein